jgi:hypothetical protein
MEPEGSLPHSKEPTICPCSEPDKSSPCSPPPPNPTSCTSTSKSLDFHPWSQGWLSCLRFVHFRFTEILKAMSIKNTVFSGVTSCQLLERCQTFRRTCYLRLHCRTVSILKNKDNGFFQNVRNQSTSFIRRSFSEDRSLDYFDINNGQMYFFFCCAATQRGSRPPHS